MASGVDYAWSHPTPAALKAAGVEFVMRYLSTDTTKALSKAEATALAAAGIWVGVVWETTATRMEAGHAGGVADAKAALAQATACGMPAGRPIYFAADWDVTQAQQTAVNAYLAGAATVLGADRVGIYGGYYTVKRALDAKAATWAWQAAAWSGGQWDTRANLQQPIATVSIGGVTCDRDTSTTSDYGQWMPGTTPQESTMALTTTDIDAVAAAVVTKLLAGGGALETSDLDRIWSADLIPAARPPYNNSDYYKADGKTPNNTTWTPKYTGQVTVENIREALALLKEIQATLGALGTGGLADQLKTELAQVKIALTVTQG